MLVFNFISAPDCDHCKEMSKALNVILDELNKKEITYIWSDIRYDIESAIDMAVKYDLDDIPSLVITSDKGFKTFVGEDYTEERIRKEVEELNENPSHSPSI